MTNKEYKRLTDTGIPTTTPDDLYNRLRELENAIESNILMFLPCKVGDTVYFVHYGFGGKLIEPYIVDRITLTSNKVIFDTHQVEPPYNLGLIYSDSWGKNVFFTKEAAEKELERWV